jgi:hypothetical protein
MPSSKSSRTSGRKGRPGKKPPYKPPKPKPPSPPPPDPLAAEPPVVVTSGSVEIDVPVSVFPVDPANPNRHRNPNRRLTEIEIQDLSGRTLMKVDLKALAGGRCKIIIRYETPGP